MVLELLYNIIKLYYPENINSIEDFGAYTNSNENRLLCKLKREVFESMKIDKDIGEVISKFNGLELISLENVTSANFDRCITLKSNIKEGTNLHQLYLRISIIVPFYTVYVLTNSISENPYRWLTQPKRDLEYEKKICKQISTLKRIVEETTGCRMLDSHLMNIKINKISYEDVTFGDFTFFNALFTNDKL